MVTPDHDDPMVAAQRQEIVLWSAPARSAVVDVMVEGAAVTLMAAAEVRRGVRAMARPVVSVVLRPPLVGPSLQPATWLRGLARRGALHRLDAQSEVAHLLDRLVPLVLATVLDRVDLNQLVRERVDLDGLVATVDLDAVLDRVDLNQIVRERVDLDGLVARVDVAALMDHLDLRSIAEQVIAEVDLPEIIRASTGSVTSETVRGVRMRSITGDDAVARAADRLRLRRRQAVLPPAPESP
jgi:hypothetical protein